MNGDGKEMEGREKAVEDNKEFAVLMWGYLPGATQNRVPILSPMKVLFPDGEFSGDSWKDVCGGGCGFAMAISDHGKIITWGSADDQSQSYLTSGKHGETPEPFPLPTEAPMVMAAAGWAHCVSVTDSGEAYTWGWKECVPSGKIVLDLFSGGSFEKDTSGEQSSMLTEEESPESQSLKSGGEMGSQPDNKKVGEESVKRRRISSAKQELESSASVDESLSAPPCHVVLDAGVRIISVAAGGRHTLALSDVGQVWGWGYGGEGQLGLGSRIKMVSSPHPIPCIDPSMSGKEKSSLVHQGSISSASLLPRVPGNYIKSIACGGRHSAVLTDAGAVITFGWGLYGQCGQGNSNDMLRPACVPSLLSTQISTIAAGLWHTICVSVDGHVHAFGGNQFGQLGLGTSTDQSENLPKFVDAPMLESKHAKAVSCGARHSAILTEDGEIYCWGWNKYGQLGLGDTMDRNVPSHVPINDCLPRNIVCGWWHTLLFAGSLP